MADILKMNEVNLPLQRKQLTVSSIAKDKNLSFQTQIRISVKFYHQIELEASQNLKIFLRLVIQMNVILRVYKKI